MFRWMVYLNFIWNNNTLQSIDVIVMFGTNRPSDVTVAWKHCSEYRWIHFSHSVNKGTKHDILSPTSTRKTLRELIKREVFLGSILSVDSQSSLIGGFFLMSNMHKMHFWPWLCPGPRYPGKSHSEWAPLSHNSSLNSLASQSWRDACNFH